MKFAKVLQMKRALFKEETLALKESQVTCIFQHNQQPHPNVLLVVIVVGVSKYYTRKTNRTQ